MNAWTVTLICPACGGGQFDIAAPPAVYRTEATASHRCRVCAAEWAIRVQLAKVKERANIVNQETAL